MFRFETFFFFFRQCMWLSLAKSTTFRLFALLHWNRRTRGESEMTENLTLCFPPVGPVPSSLTSFCSCLIAFLPAQSDWFYQQLDQSVVNGNKYRTNTPTTLTDVHLWNSCSFISPNLSDLTRLLFLKPRFMFRLCFKLPKVCAQWSVHTLG